MVTALNMTEVELSHRAHVAASCHSVPVMPEDKSNDNLLVMVHKVSEVLHRKYGADRVVLFESLAYGVEWWSDSSDIDLAVKGLSGSKYWRAWKTVEDMLPNRTVDLVDFDMATSSLRMAIDQYGVEL